MRLWLVFLALLPILLVGSGPGAGASTQALPPHNGLIAVHGNDGLYLVDSASGDDVVVVLDVATGKETVLSGEQQRAQAPEWSPEGDQIAFLSMRLRETQPATTGHSCGGEPYDTHLWSMRPDGTKARRLAKGEFYGRPSWGRAVEVASAPALVPSESR